MTRLGPANFGCEAITGWDTTGPGGTPYGIRCQQDGVERKDVPVLRWFTILCDGCYSKIVAKREKASAD